MKVIIFGASGMVGQGVLRECLLDSEISEVLCVGRSALQITHPKLKQIHLPELDQLESQSGALSGYDACLFTLGATAAGKNEAEYSKINYELPVLIAHLLLKLNPGMSFGYVSGTGCDGTEKGPIMWARVKGKTENALMKMPFKSATMFRPGMILSKNGEVSSTKMYRYIYNATKPLHKLIETFLPKYLVTTEQVGRAMIDAAKNLTGPNIFEIPEIQRHGG
ncbi:MAG: epimerase [Bdellovibrionaceae bacterium]|nr:epimerase [Pseudobdellovibrionaceae bacterium]